MKHNQNIITIGRDPSNTIVVKHQSVSRFHSRLELKEQKFILYDLDSKNGTFINDIRIKKGIIEKSDKLVLGGYATKAENVLVKATSFIHINKVDYSNEFPALLSSFQEYQNKLEKITKRPIAPLMIRLVLGILGIAIILTFSDLNHNIRYALILSIGILSMGSTYFLPGKVKQTEQVDLLRLEYEKILLCPKCKGSLMNRTYIYWKNATECHRKNCDAMYKNI